MGGKLGRKASRVWRRWQPPRWQNSVPNPALAAALGPRVNANTDIHDHLGTIFSEAVSVRPRLLVELGTRGGVSTCALLAAAEVADAHPLSIDIADCSGVDLPARFRARWSFVQADDVAYAASPFEAFCASRGLPAMAELILVDTSHLYDHTRAEIAAWMPRLAPGGVMLFHDTNMGRGWFRRLNGRAEPSWDNERGVIRAIEEFLGRRYDETTCFVDALPGFMVEHVPWSSGFLVLRRRPANAA
jgi:cephalosporin hydroxylase